MRLEVNKYLYDIQHAAELATQFTADKTFADYQQDPVTTPILNLLGIDGRSKETQDLAAIEAA